MKKFSIVYMTVNLVTGDFYIGKHETNNLQDRYLGSGLRLKNSVKKYGPDNFERKIISTWNNPQDALQEERKIVAQYLDHPQCLNIVDGGKGFSSASAARASKIAQQMGKAGTKSLTKEQLSKAGSASAKVNAANKTGMWAITPEQRSRTSSETNKNTVWINNGSIEQKVKNGQNIPQGFVKGRLSKGSTYRKGLKCWTDGKTNIFAESCPGPQYYQGMTKETHIPEFKWWNNGEINVRSMAQPEGFVSGTLKWKSRTVTCPYCSKEGGETAMKRHHFDNCKRKPK